MPPAPTLDLEHLTPDAIVDCSRALLQCSAGASHRRRVAERIVSHFYDNARIPATRERSCVLVRCFQTAAYAQLPLDYQEAADRLLDAMPSQPDMRCLALLATRGRKTLWNDVATSTAHQCIPLPSAEVVRRAPMIARLLDDLGISAEQAVAPPASPGFMLHALPRELNVFHISDALGSPFIPAQSNFVEPFGIHSVLGMGGLLPDGDFFAILLFTRVPISREAAELFQGLAASAGQALEPFTAANIFFGKPRR